MSFINYFFQKQSSLAALQY